MLRRNMATVLVAAALIVVSLVAFILALAQDKLPELVLDLVVYLFAVTFTVFVVGRMLAWREGRRWLVAKSWLHMLLLETIDDLLKELLPAAVPREGLETEEEVTVYEVAASGFTLARWSPTVRYDSWLDRTTRICSHTSPATPRKWARHDTRSWQGRLCPERESR
jgi:hypothetical protein